jgi:hypothetical protein
VVDDDAVASSLKTASQFVMGEGGGGSLSMFSSIRCQIDVDTYLKNNEMETWTKYKFL